MKYCIFIFYYIYKLFSILILNITTTSLKVMIVCVQNIFLWQVILVIVVWKFIVRFIESFLCYFIFLTICNRYLRQILVLAYFFSLNILLCWIKYFDLLNVRNNSNYLSILGFDKKFSSLLVYYYYNFWCKEGVLFYLDA